VFNVAQQIGTPIGIAIANIVANGVNSPTATGVGLLPGYRAAFYCYAVMAGVGLVVTIIFGTNSDPVSMHATSAEEGDMITTAGNEEAAHEKAGQVASDSKKGALSGSEGSLTSLKDVDQPHEKSELKG
jgi:hypothetical protein